MNEISQPATALALPEPATLATMFKAENGLNPLLDKIKADALAIVKDLDPANKKDRDLMRSAAFKVSQSKAEIDRRGKDLTEAQRKEVAAVNAGRSVADRFLSALRDQVKKPAEDWEAKDAARIEAIKLRMTAFRPMHVPSASDGLRALIAEVEAVTVDASWQEFQTEAAEAKAMCLNRLDEHLQAAIMRDEAAELAARQAAELEALRAEKAARDEADRLRVEAEAAEARRIDEAKQEADRLRIAAERAEADRIAAERAEAALVAQIEADKIAAAKLAQEQAEAKAKAEAERVAKEAADREAALLQAQADAAARHAKEIVEAKAREEAAAQVERDRIAAQIRAEADARAKREADQAHRSKIHADIAAALQSMSGSATPSAIASAIMDGKIPHVVAVL